MRDRLVLAGFALLGFVLFLGIALTAASSPIIRVGIVAVPAALAIAAWIGVWKDVRAVGAFRQRYGSEGKDLLIVYSESPVWQQYIEDNWIQRWAERTVVLNRSAPEWDKRPEARLWRRLAGAREHTPVAIVVPEQGRPTIVRFYLAFRDYKHGRGTALREKERELEAALAGGNR